MFDELLEQDEFVRKQRERGLQEGLQKGLQEGLQKGLQEGATKEAKEVLINYISIRYPSLIDLARQYTEKSTQKAVLQNILNMIFAAPDEATVRFILSASSPAA